jgi:hypothetical protein
VDLVIQKDVIGHDLLLGKYEQRMTRLLQPHTAVPVERNRVSSQLSSQCRSSRDGIQVSEGFQAHQNDVGLFGDTAGQVAKDPQHFPIDFTIGHLDRVVEIDQLARLQKHCSAAGRDIVNDACDTELHVDLDGNDIAAFPLGEVLLLKDFGISA